MLWYLPFFDFLSVLFYGQPGQQSPQFGKLTFLCIIIRSDLLVEIRGSACTSKSHRSLRVSFSMTYAGLCIYHLFLWSNLKFMHISQWTTYPTVSYLVWYPFCANLLHSLTISLYYHKTYVCCFVASYQLSLWYDWFLQRCFVLLLKEILFFP